MWFPLGAGIVFLLDAVLWALCSTVSLGWGLHVAYRACAGGFMH